MSRCLQVTLHKGERPLVRALVGPHSSPASLIAIMPTELPSNMVSKLLFYSKDSALYN